MGGVGRQAPVRPLNESESENMRGARRYLPLVVLCGLTPLLSACGLASTATSHSTAAQTPAAANAGERVGTVPSSATRQEGPLDPAGTPQQALERFAESYINWTWRTLADDQQHLAASAVGEARRAELQARQQTARDTPLRRGRIFNRGVIVAVASVRGGSPAQWIIDTREQTGGEGEYAELRPGFHVTLAAVARVQGGWAVSSWRPEL
jgi:hypothetical protein